MADCVFTGFTFTLCISELIVWAAVAAEPGGLSPPNEKSGGAKGMFSPPQYLPSAPRTGDRLGGISKWGLNIFLIGKCRFRPYGGFVKPKILGYAPHQPMVALRLDNPAGTQSLAQISPPNIFFVPPRLMGCMAFWVHHGSPIIRKAYMFGLLARYMMASFPHCTKF